MGTPLQTYKHEAASPLGSLYDSPYSFCWEPGAPASQASSCCWTPWGQTWSSCCQTWTQTCWCQTWKKTCRCQTCQTWQTSKQQRKIVHLESGYATGQPHGKPGPWTTGHNLATLIFPGP